MLLKFDHHGQTVYLPLTALVGITWLPPVVPPDPPTGGLEIQATTPVFADPTDGELTHVATITDPAEVARLLGVLDALTTDPTASITATLADWPTDVRLVLDRTSRPTATP